MTDDDQIAQMAVNLGLPEETVRSAFEDLDINLLQRSAAARREADLEVELAEAKEEYRGNPDDEDAKQRLHDAKQAIVAARSARRGEGTVVGGDAVQGSER